MKPKEKREYTIAIVMADNTLKSAFTGGYMECIYAAEYLLNKYNWSRNEIVFMDNATFEIASHITRSFLYRNPEKKQLAPWDKDYKRKKRRKKGE